MSKFPKGHPERWEHIAEQVNGKTKVSVGFAEVSVKTKVSGWFTKRMVKKKDLLIFAEANGKTKVSVGFTEVGSTEVNGET